MDLFTRTLLTGAGGAVTGDPTWTAVLSRRSNFNAFLITNPLDNSSIINNNFAIGLTPNGTSTISSVSNEGTNNWGYYFTSPGTSPVKTYNQAATADLLGNTYLALLDQNNNTTIVLKISPSGTILQKKAFKLTTQPYGFSATSPVYNPSDNTVTFVSSSANDRFLRFYASNLTYINTVTSSTVSTSLYGPRLILRPDGNYVYVKDSDDSYQKFTLTFGTNLAAGTKTAYNYSDPGFGTNTRYQYYQRDAASGPSNETVVCGDFGRIVNGSQTNIGVFVTKIDSSGNVQWVRGLNNFLDINREIEFRTVNIDEDGSIYCTGSLQRVASDGNFDYQTLVCKFNSSGGLVYCYTVGVNNAVKSGDRVSYGTLKSEGGFQIYRVQDQNIRSTDLLTQLKSDGSMVGTLSNDVVITQRSPSVLSLSLNRATLSDTYGSTSNYSSQTDNTTAVNFSLVSSTTNI